MRLGGPLFEQHTDPCQWAAALSALGCSAAFFPDPPPSGEAAEQAFARAAADAGIVIAEVGAWSNPLSPDDTERTRAVAHVQERLALADRVGARCCVNIAGSRGARWDGPDPRNLTQETFDAIVQVVRRVIDAVKPTRTFYTLEPMPWMYPDSAESYLRLIAAIDRAAFAVHFDPVNLISSPRRYFGNGALIHDFVASLGSHIKSCHAKDILLRETLTTHLDEVLAGEGALDYRVFVTEVERLDPQMPLLVEHMGTQAECVRAMDHVRNVAADVGVAIIAPR